MGEGRTNALVEEFGGQKTLNKLGGGPACGPGAYTGSGEDCIE